jgi:hypothetical protein
MSALTAAVILVGVFTLICVAIAIAVDIVIGQVEKNL